MFFDSPPYSGFSVDNLSPDVPADLSISNSIVDNDTYQVDLSWSAPIADDFAYHNVYRSDLNNEEAAIVFEQLNHLLKIWFLNGVILNIGSQQ